MLVDMWNPEMLMKLVTTTGIQELKVKTDTNTLQITRLSLNASFAMLCFGGCEEQLFAETFSRY